MREATLDQGVKVFQRPNASWSAFIQETARFGPILVSKNLIDVGLSLYIKLKCFII